MTSLTFTFAPTTLAPNRKYSSSFRHQTPTPTPHRRPRTLACANTHQSRRKVRSDPTQPSFIPQTIEYAIRCAQRSTAHALSSGLTHVRIELPMGRSRKHWYRMSPLDSWYTETSVLAFHFCEMFKGMHITLVLGAPPGVSHPVHWLADLCPAEHVQTHDFTNSPDTVVIIAGVSKRQRHVIAQVLQRAPRARAFILFNSLVELPPTHNVAPFQPVYICRALDKSAVFKECLTEPWAIFVEIAVFEYEWIGVKDQPPNQRGIDTFALERDAKKRGIHGYYESEYAGCEAGFWPFMTICCREVLPMDGTLLEKSQKDKAAKKLRKASRPFGFF